jgi:hypothetical protein
MDTGRNSQSCRWSDRQLDRLKKTGRQVYGQTNRETRQTDRKKQTARETDRWIDRQKDGRTDRDRWMDGRRDRQPERQTDGWVDR